MEGDDRGSRIIYLYNHKKDPPVILYVQDEEEQEPSESSEVEVEPNILPLQDLQGLQVFNRRRRRQAPPPPSLSTYRTNVQIQIQIQSQRTKVNAGRSSSASSSSYFRWRGCFMCNSKEHLVDENSECKEAFRKRGSSKKAIKKTLQILDEIEPGKGKEQRTRTNRIINVKHHIKKIQKQIAILGSSVDKMEKLKHWEKELIQIKSTKIIATPRAERSAAQK